jgi:hypothetical protein
MDDDLGQRMKASYIGEVMTTLTRRILGTHGIVSAVILATAAGAHPALAQNVPVRTLVQDLKIDGETNDMTAAFSLLVAPNGNIIVLGRDPYRGKVFAPNGRLIRSFARQGQGPGEISTNRPMHAGMVGDTLWIHDTGRKTSLFTSDGTHIRDVPFTRSRDPWQDGHPEYVGTSTGLTPQRLLPGGIALATAGLNGVLAKPTTTPPLFRTTWEGQITGIPVKLPLENLFFRVPEVTGRGFQQVFAHMPKYALSEDGRRLVIARVRDGTGPYVELLHLVTTGDTIATHRVPFTQVPITRRSVDSLIASWNAPFPEGRGRPPGYQPPSLAPHERAIRDSLIVPRYFSPFSDVMLANDGTTWLRWHVPGNDRRWLLVSPRGEVLMQVEQPTSGGDPRVIDGAIWGAAVDSLGFISVIRYAVR